MKANRFIPFVFGLLLVTLASGCATNKLWTETSLDNWNEPADDVRLQLFQTPDQKNFLVVYNEYSERSDSVHRRAYLLKQSQQRINDRRAPYFTSPTPGSGFTAVPVFSSSTSPAPNSPAPFAVQGHQCFTLNENASTNVYDLPVYNDGKATLERAALTPLTVTADMTVVGGYFWVQMGCPWLVDLP